MVDRKELGRIHSASFGFGGYQDAQIGLSLAFTMKGSGVAHFDGYWSSKPSSGAAWTESDQVTALGETVMSLAGILEKAKRNDVAGLMGVPVELTFTGNVLKSWRVLEEVL